MVDRELQTSAELNWEGTPLMVGGVLYVTAGTRRVVAAIDDATGETLWMWRYDEGRRGQVAPNRASSGRGAAYWTDGKGDKRILVVTAGYRLAALNAKTGVPIPSFGSAGIVDLYEGLDQPLPRDGQIGLSSPPLVVGDVAVQGRGSSPGDGRQPAVVARVRPAVGPQLVTRRANMRTLTTGIGTGFLVVAVAAITLSSEEGGYNHNVTKQDLTRWEKELSNWGRWGKDDQKGALNLITPAKRKQAAALVKEGFSVSLASDANTTKELDNPNPYEHTMLGLGADRIGVQFHGWAHTHLDSLAHHFNEEGKAFNGYLPDKDVVLKSGHTRNSIHVVKNGIVTRGILMDMPRLKGVPYLEPGTPIYPEDLEAWEKKAGVNVSAGDALLVRTGRWTARRVIGPFIIGRNGKAAGLHASVLPWLKKRDIAVLGGDGAQSVAPSDLPGAIHDLSMVVLGVHVLDDADFEALAEAAAARNRWEFMLTIAPLPIRGGTGSPVNPIATF